MSPYRTGQPPKPAPKKPFLCRMGWHAWGKPYALDTAPTKGPSGEEWVDFERRCRRCAKARLERVWSRAWYNYAAYTLLDPGEYRLPSKDGEGFRVPAWSTQRVETGFHLELERIRSQFLLDVLAIDRAHPEAPTRYPHTKERIRRLQEQQDEILRLTREQKAWFERLLDHPTKGQR